MFLRDIEPIVTACEKSREHKKTGWNQVFQEVYLLTHPYYNLTGNEEFFGNYHDVLLQSISAVRQRSYNSLGILTLNGDEKFEVTANNPIQKYIHAVLLKMQEIFGERLHVRIQTSGYYEKGIHDLPLKLHPNVFVTARGIWGNRCVLTSLEDFSHVHAIKEEMAILAVSESRIHTQDNFPIPEKGAFTISKLRELGKLRVKYPKLA